MIAMIKSNTTGISKAIALFFQWVPKGALGKKLRKKSDRTQNKHPKQRSKKT
jgi:hypothetical protein